ncbi:MAG TPA: AMP nucleosidase [Terriglobia bacterium]|nr:AMP nucleosidase [Terriglobia bacterium]
MSEGRMNFQRVKSPDEALERLQHLHQTATNSLRAALERFLTSGTPPNEAEMASFRYPELRITYQPEGVMPISPRAYAKFQGAGVYSTTVTQPGHFAGYLREQIGLLMSDFDAVVEVGVSKQEIPYPYVVDSGDELGSHGVTAAELARFFPVPLLAMVGDEIADGLWEYRDGEPRPLALFDAMRVDFSLKRLTHYTGTDWRAIQPWILLTNYHRYVDQFVRWGLEQLQSGGRFQRMVLPENVTIERDMPADEALAKVMGIAWHRFQMPAYHLIAQDGHGISLVNIGVGPANAKNITDHLAVLRPHCWLMIGHCGGLRQSQTIGDYVLAHGYLRQDGILDDVVPPDMPIPALAEVQVALQEAAAQVTGDHGEALKRRLRTGTVMTNDDRNWEFRWQQERRRINLSRAIAVDMESGTIAAQGYRLRVPYGTLLCVSDKPLHGEIKLPGAANAFYERAVGEHLEIGLTALDLLRTNRVSLHSRKLRSFDEPPFR